MLRERKPITIDPDSELGRALDEATEAPVVLEKNGVRYLVSRENSGTRPDISEEQYQKILDETLGSWSDIDADALIADIYRWREEGTRPADRPLNMFREAFGADWFPPSVDDDKEEGSVPPSGGG